jgi:hypothetical protein
MDILEKAVQRRSHNPLHLGLRGELNMQGPEARIGALTELGGGRRLRSALCTEPGFHRVLILRGRKAEARRVANQRYMAIARTTAPRILRGGVPQQLELVRKKGTDGGRHLLEFIGEVAQVLHHFEQDGHTVAIRVPMTGVDEGTVCRA